MNIMTKEQIDLAVINTIWQLIREPLTYFSEADIQQLLVQNLNKIMPEPVATNMARGKKRGKPELEKDADSKYETPLIHREYGGGKGTRIDVVIFDPADVAKINTPKLCVDDEYLTPLFAFEIGTESAAPSCRETEAHVQNDLIKLKRCLRENGHGYIIHFYRNNALTPVGGNRRDQNEQRIERNFKDVFEDLVSSRGQEVIPPNIHIAAVVRHVHRGRNNCDVLTNGEWHSINVNTRDVENMQKVLRAKPE